MLLQHVKHGFESTTRERAISTYVLAVVTIVPSTLVTSEKRITKDCFHTDLVEVECGVGVIKVYITTGIPTRVVGTCFSGENLEAASNLPI